MLVCCTQGGARKLPYSFFLFDTCSASQGGTSLADSWDCEQKRLASEQNIKVVARPLRHITRLETCVAAISIAALLSKGLVAF